MRGHFTFIEDEKLGKAYDSELMKKLLTFLSPYRKLIYFSLVLLVFTSIFDVSLPFITKTAIDRYIVKATAIIKPAGMSLEKMKGALIPLGHGEYLVDLTKLNRTEKLELEKRGLLSKEKYLFIEKKAAQKADIEAIIKKYPHIFEKVPKGYIADYRNLSALKKSELRTIRKEDFKGVLKMAFIFSVILLLNFLFTYGQIYVLQLAGQRVMYDMRIKIFNHLLKLPVKYFDRNPVGKLVTRATNDVAAINEMYTSVLVYLLKDILLIFGILIVMLKMNVGLTLLIFILSPLVALIATVFRKKAREAYRQVRRWIANLNAFLQESISGMRIIHLFTSESYMMRKFEDINHRLYLSNMKQITVFAIFRPLIEVISALGLALILWYGGGEVIKANLTFGALVAFISYVEMLFRPIRDLSDKYNILQGAMAAGERIFRVLEEKPEERGGGFRKEKLEGHIIFEKVWFAYENEDWVLKDVSFEIMPGETVALVGPTGSGKTTIINLLLRFYDVSKGRILIDGVDIKDYDISFLRSQMAIVLQDVFLFGEDIKTNISLFGEMEEEKIKRAAEYVYATKFIEKHSGGFSAKLGERGLNLSVGERQLIAFARALAHEPRILVLDEATSSVDTETEETIRKALKKLLSGRTSIVIAHRLSTIKDADKIFVIYRGKLVESGTHDELIEKRGLYYQLYSIQFGIIEKSP